jgi:PadR family transcriptional regulator AphA
LVNRTDDQPLLLGEWACLGVLYQGKAHGFAVAARLKPGGDIGRVWSLSRALTYRSLEQLEARTFVCAVGTEPGIAGGSRRLLAATRLGRSRLRSWLRTPVAHLRDLRSELLLKLLLAEQCGIDLSAMLTEQRLIVQRQCDAYTWRARQMEPAPDVVALWRREHAAAALRFLDQIG